VLITEIARGLFDGRDRKSRDKASLLPKLYVTAIYELLCLLDRLLIVSTFDDLRPRCDMAVSINKKNAIFRHDGHSDLLANQDAG